MTALLYLHGVGDDGTRRDWWDTLTLAADSPLPDVRVIAPDYSDLLSAPSTDLPRSRHPAVTGGSPTPADRRHYQAAQTQRHADLMAAGSHATWPHRRRGFARVPGMIDAIGEKIVMGMIYEEVGRFVVEDVRRRAVLDRVLAALPPEGPVVVVGHSLGALVALEVVRHLPDGVHVPLLLTAASALARRTLPADLADLNEHFPYDRVGGWVNVFNPSDPVTRGLPIGLRFPQAIDVSVAAGFADHALAACLADTGVARVLARSLHEPVAPAASAAQTPWELPHAVRLARLQVTWHLEQLLAQEPGVSVAELTRFLMARRLVGETTALRGEPDEWDWDADHATDLRTRVAEQDVAAVLVHLAGSDPMAPATISVDPVLVERARRLTVADLGVPPSWYEVARQARAEAAGAVRPRRRRGGDPEPPDDEDVADDTWVAGIAASVRDSLAPLAIDDAVPSRVPSGLGDLRPACRELIARALTAQRLGTPAAGTRERTVLSSLMVLLGQHRVRVGAAGAGHERLRNQLQRRAAVVAQSLSWFATHGIGMQPADLPAR